MTKVQNRHFEEVNEIDVLAHVAMKSVFPYGSLEENLTRLLEASSEFVQSHQAYVESLNMGGEVLSADVVSVGAEWNFFLFYSKLVEFLEAAPTLSLSRLSESVMRVRNAAVGFTSWKGHA